MRSSQYKTLTVVIRINIHSGLCACKRAHADDGLFPSWCQGGRGRVERLVDRNPGLLDVIHGEWSMRGPRCRFIIAPKRRTSARQGDTKLL